VLWICGTLGSFSDAEKTDFVKLVTTIIKYAPPGYTPPNRKRCAGPLLDAQYDKTKKRVDEVLNMLDATCGLTFVSDGHSDKTRHPMVNYIAASPKGSIHLWVDDLSGENKDCISQAKRMVERMKATGKEKCFFLAVLDGVLRACFPHLEKEMPWLTAIWCGCHVLSLFFKTALLRSMS
jgi:hypothetical protein